MPGTNDAKRELRRAMRAVRLAAADARGSAAIVERLERLPAVTAVAAGETVMIFEPVPGEPDLRSLADRLRGRGVTVVVPRADPGAPMTIPPSTVDVVVVPGLAFTRDGDRLGQGGGWYDRFLSGVRRDTLVVGVCFDEQLVDSLPTEPHDVAMTHVVTPVGTFPGPDADDPGTEAPGSSSAIVDRGGAG